MLGRRMHVRISTHVSVPHEGAYSRAWEEGARRRSALLLEPPPDGTEQRGLLPGALAGG